jgi:hypothetical protein
MPWTAYLTARKLCDQSDVQAFPNSSKSEIIDNEWKDKVVVKTRFGKLLRFTAECPLATVFTPSKHEKAFPVVRATLQPVREQI